MIDLGTETLTLSNGTEIDVKLGLSLSVIAERPPLADGPPEIVSGTVGPDPANIVLVFNRAVTWIGANPRGLGIFGGSGLGTVPGADWTLTYVSGKGTNTLTFTGDGQIGHGEDVGITYDADDSPGNLTSAAGTPMEELLYNDTLIANNIPDTTAPDAGGAVLSSGTTFRVSFTESGIVGGTSGNGGFTVSASGGAATLSYSSSPNTYQRDYTISRTIAQGETVTFSYSAGDIEDAAGNAMAGFSGRSATNGSTVDTTAPTITESYILTGTTQTALYVRFSESGVTGGTNGDGGFTITASGGAVTASYVSSQADARLYATSRFIDWWETVTISYTQGGNGNIQDAAGNALANVTNRATPNLSQTRIDFNSGSSPTIGGVTHTVALTDGAAYAEPPHYGFNTTALHFDRTTAPGCTSVNFFRDAAYNASGDLAPFKLRCPVGGSLKVRIYAYDQYSAWGDQTVSGDGAADQTLTISNSAPNSIVMTLVDGDNDGIVSFTCKRAPNGVVALCNGVDVVEASASLPTALT